MNNEALVLTDRSCTDSDRILKFIQTKGNLTFSIFKKLNKMVKLAFK